MEACGRGKPDIVRDRFNTVFSHLQAPDRDVPAQRVLDGLEGRTISLKPADQRPGRHVKRFGRPDQVRVFPG